MTFQKLILGRDVFVESITVLDGEKVIKHEKASFMKNFVAPSFFRLSGDNCIYYGDGGRSNLFYPIYYHPKLGISDNTREKLFELLQELNKKRNDVQPNGITEDIIDPDLNPYILDPEEKEKALDIVKKRIEEMDLSRDSETWMDSSSIRKSYSWIPTEFYISENGIASIKSRIHNLPATQENKPLYHCILKVFQEMVPTFQSLGIIKKGISQNLQIVVKAQNYNFFPNVNTYSGKWHTEGSTENIIAAGVYYCHISPGLECGNLKFRPPSVPHDSYNFKTDIEVPIEEGCAVVFSNAIPHRFRKIYYTAQNGTCQNRTFLNFFIIDPKYRLKSTKNIPSLEFLISLLRKCIFSVISMEFPVELIKKILFYVPEIMSEEESHAFRQRSRDELTNDKSGWGWLHWGNAGTANYFESFNQWNESAKATASYYPGTESDEGKK